MHFSFPLAPYKRSSNNYWEKNQYFA